MATRLLLTPNSAEFPSANFPELTISNTTDRRPVLGFDATTQETAYWTAIAPQGWTGTITAVLTFAMASATSNAVVMEVGVEAITDADAMDTDSASSFDTYNTSASTTVPGTAGNIKQVSVTLTTNDSSAAADYLRIGVRRAPANAGDTATGDLLFLAAEIRDAA